MTRRRRKFRLVRLLLLGFLVVGAGVGYEYWIITTPKGKGASKLFTVQPGQSVRSIAGSLAQAGLIRSKHGFLVLSYVTGKYRHLQAGRYALAPTMSIQEMLDALTQGTHRAWNWITVPEGYTVRQIAETLARENLAKKDTFLQLSTTPGEITAGFPLPKTGLEGYLFPDTYRLDVGETETEIATQMLQRFREIVWKGLFQERAQYGNRKFQDIITLASLVEAEAKKEEERPVIAGVLWNRLQRGQRLECDATVQYALGVERKPRLLYKDLAIDSEYNTYLHKGLPPGPIDNPGAASIRAAMEPARVPYLYYVAKPDGSHIFSNTFEQHTAAIARLRQQTQGAAR